MTDLTILEDEPRPATDALVAHLDHGECYAENYADEDFGAALLAVYEAAHSLIGVTRYSGVTGAEYQDRKSGLRPPEGDAA